MSRLPPSPSRPASAAHAAPSAPPELRVTRRPAQVHEAFARHAAQAPARIALRHARGATSYGELDARAAAIAAALRAAGVAPGGFVGIGLVRSPEQIALLLGVLKAGAAFVPLDPAQPAERRCAMAADAGVRLIVGEPGAAPCASAPTLTLGELLAAASERTETPAPIADGHERPAYLLYTSGSTGRPKGVLVDGRALALRLAGMQRRLPLQRRDRMLQRTTLGFDVAIEEIFWPLSVGASLVLAEPGEELDAAKLVARMAHEAVSVADFVPSLLERVLAQPALTACTRLRRLLCGGEALPAELMYGCLRVLPAVELWNVYGPTEAVINALVWRARADHAGAPPIGRPLPHTRAVLLNEAGRVCAPGEAGELCLGGVLAQGYAGAAQLTRERFVADPKRRSATLYRSGDLARLRSDGEFEFLGRLDRQVKLRGVRIELGEIEAALLAHPAVRGARVQLESESEAARLIAYVETDLDQSAARWREQLAARLPRTMLPSAYRRLDALPLNAAGKLDVQALASLQQPAEAAPSVAADGALLDHVRALFAGTLRRTDLSDDEDFFELGGDSLQATELLAELDELAGLDLPLQTLYEHPSATALAVHLQERVAALQGGSFSFTREFADPKRVQATSRTPNLVQLRAGTDASAPRLFCIHPGDGGSSMYLPLVRLLREPPTVCALTAWDLRRRPWPQKTLQAIATDYVEQIVALQPQGPYHLTGWSSGAVLAYEIAQQLEAAGHRLGAVGLIDPFEPWEAERGAAAEPLLDDPAAPFSDDDWRIVLMMFALDACVPAPGHDFWRMSEPRRFDWVRETAQALGRFPPSLDRETFTYLSRVVRMHCRACDHYAPTRSGFDFTLFLPLTSEPDNVNARCWPPLSSGRCEIVPVGGDHLSMVRVPHVASVARVLDERIASSSAKARP